MFVRAALASIGEKRSTKTGAGSGGARGGFLKLIERYIFRRAFVALLVATGGLVGVVWVAQAFREVDVVTSKGQGVWLYLGMTSLGVPSLAAAVLPVALLIALGYAINAFNADSELIVVNASGASKTVVAKPFLVLGLIVSLVIYALAFSVGPTTMRMLRAIISNVNADLVTTLVREGDFTELGSGLTVHIGARRPGGVLAGILILDRREAEQTFTYLASEGRVESVNGGALLLLQNGELQRTSAGTDALSTITFDSYAFDLTTLTAGPTFSYSSAREIPTRDLIDPPLEHALYKQRPQLFQSELHNRLTAGLYPIAFVLMILAVAGNARSTRGSFVKVLIAAALFCLAMRGAGIAAVGAAKSDPDALWFVWGIPLFTMALPLFYLVRGRQMEWPDLASELLDRLRALATPQPRRAPA